MKIKDCMCEDICICSPEDTVYECAKLMNDNHIGCIPVCNSNKHVVGLVTDRDLVLRCIANNKDPQNTKLSDIMSCGICCCTKDQDINEAENKMCNTQIRRIPIVNERNEIVGMLSLGDLAKNSDISKQEVGNTVENICNCNSSNNKNCD